MCVCVKGAKSTFIFPGDLLRSPLFKWSWVHLTLVPGSGSYVNVSTLIVNYVIVTCHEKGHSCLLRIHGLMALFNTKTVN